MSWPAVDFGAVNTALIIAAIAYLYKQARVVDQVRQALLGFEGKGGIIEEVKMLRQRTHDLANAMQVLSVSLEHLAQRMETRETREPGEERRRGYDK